MFAQQNWANRLGDWRRVEVSNERWHQAIGGVEIVTAVGAHYMDADDNVRAWIVAVTRPDGTTINSVRELRDDAGVQYLPQ